VKVAADVKPLVSLLGLGFDDLDLEQAASWIASRPAKMPFGYIVTPNADHLVRLNRDPALLAIYRGASLCLLDSRVGRGVGAAVEVARACRCAGE
jgi:N-acetylglucosaminyldiphosphoundecaprenol N-acetyl-beta-D-mannosaminyltransferase